MYTLTIQSHIHVLNLKSIDPLGVKLIAMKFRWRDVMMDGSTDRCTDRRTEGYTDIHMVTIYHPLIEKGYNYLDFFKLYKEWSIV